MTETYTPGPDCDPDALALRKAWLTLREAVASKGIDQELASQALGYTADQLNRVSQAKAKRALHS